MTEASVVLSPQAAPGKCYYCGISSSRERWLDTGIQIEFYGALYFCDQCFTWLADLLDFISPDKATELKLVVEALQLENETLNERNKALTEAINSMKVIHVDRSNLDRDSNLFHPSTSELLEINPDSLESAGEGESGLGDRTEQSSESSDDEGMDELRSDGNSDSNEEFAGFEI